MKKNKFRFFLIFGIIVLCPQIALADEIIVEDADAVWDLTLDNATDAPILLGDEIIVEDAEAVWNLTLENATSIGWLVGEPGVMVTKYADTFSYRLRY